jgi:hypothetical protein
LLGSIASEDDDSEDSNEYSEEEEDVEDENEEEDEDSNGETGSNESDDSAESGSDEVSDIEIAKGSSGTNPNKGDSVEPSNGNTEVDEYDSGDTSDEEVCDLHSSPLAYCFTVCVRI